tara:strand:- start:679 stop:951 length:273 start_codon:yes stop_codon:yes gene_type:complete
MSNVLTLTLKKQYFEAILSGEKTIEYRDITDYWTPRLENKEHDTIVFRNGYSATSPKMTVEYKGLTIDRDSSPNRYALLLGKVLTTENVN